MIRRGGGIGHSELNGCQIVKRIGRSLLIEEGDIVVDLFFDGTLVTWKFMNSSALIQPLIASIAALSVGVLARDMERTTYVGKSSLNAFDAYTAP